MWPFTASTSSTQHPEAAPSACPVDHSTRAAWSGAGLDSTEIEGPASRPGYDSRRLSTEREVSSIPRWLPPPSSSPSSSDEEASAPPSACPAHSTPTVGPPGSGNTPQENAAKSPGEENWVYPSPSSFYSALQRKDRNPQARDMGVVVPIHNMVNERVWREVEGWEREAIQLGAEGEVGGAKDEANGKSGSKLVSFVGKPRELSPRARWKTMIGYTAPFDRHDWIVDRPLPSSPSSISSSSEASSSPSPPRSSIRIRYIIDFYTGRQASLLSSGHPLSSSAGGGGGMPPNLAFYLDVRPALDSWEGVRMRCSRWWKGVSGFGVSSSKGREREGERTVGSSSSS